MADLTRSEHEDLLAFAETALNAERAAVWWEAFAELVMGSLLHADIVAVASIDHRGEGRGTFGLIRPAWVEQAVPSGSAMHADLIRDHPLTVHLRSARAAETVRVSDLVPPSTWCRMAGYSKMKELIGATHQMNITVRADCYVSLSTSPIRVKPDFTEHEVQVAGHLQRLLCAADRHSRVLDKLRAERPSDELLVFDAVATHFGLTRREVVVLSLLAEGMTTTAAARALGISARTVSKHQGNIYRKLQVRDRLAAVMLARRSGLLSWPEISRSR